MSQSFLVAANNTGIAFADNTTRWNTLEGLIVAGQTTESWAEISYREAGTFDDLKTYVSANTTLVTTVITIRKNSADTTLTVSYTSGQTGEKLDTTNSFTVDSSDVLASQITVPNDASGAKTITLHLTSVTFTSDVSNNCISLLATSGQGQNVYSLGSQNYVLGGGPEGGAIYYADNYIHFDTGVVASNLFGQIDTNDSTGGTTILRTVLNGTNGNQSVTYTAGQTGGKEDTSNTDATSAGISLRAVTTASGGTQVWLDCIVVKGLSYKGVFLRAIGSTAGTGYTGTHYNNVGGATSVAVGAEANSRTPVSFSQSATNFYSYCLTNSSTLSSTINFRKNGVTVATITYAVSESGYKIDYTTVTVAVDDYLGWQIVQGGTGTLTILFNSFEGIVVNSGWVPRTKVITTV